MSTQALKRVTQLPVKNRAETIEILLGNADAIKALGATALFLFGSAARDEMGPDSDVDVFIDYGPTARSHLSNGPGWRNCWQTGLAETSMY